MCCPRPSWQSPPLMETAKPRATQGMCSSFGTRDGDGGAGALFGWIKAGLQRTETSHQLPLTLHFFYLHLPGYALGFEVVKVSLKLHPSLKQDNTAVSRVVWRGRLLHLQGFLMAGLGSIARGGYRVQTRNSHLGLIFWAISETTFNPKVPHPQVSTFIIWALNFPGFWKAAVVLRVLWCRTNSIWNTI